MSWLLLTNDDGIDSPALLPFARALAELGEVRVVVPDRERSWVGKAITRYDPVTVTAVERGEIPVWTCSGYPADAVQLGLYGLFPEPPRMVISGINLGYNHGTGYLMSSGTVGAAVEGWIGGIPSIALSTGTVGDWQGWRLMAHDPASAPRWERTARFCTQLIVEVEKSGLMDQADVVSINLPFDPPPDVSRRVTSIARVGYDRLFQPDGEGRWVHEYGGGVREFEPLDGTDVDAANRGEVAITPLRMPAAAPVSPDIRHTLER